MPHKTATRLRELLEELERAQHEAGGLANQARQDLADAMHSGELKPVGTSGTARRRKKAGKKKR